jgi:peptidylprolyl isomerase
METENEEWKDVSIAKDGGVKKKILAEAPADAEGPPPLGYEVSAHYTGTLKADGSKFDSSVDRGKAFKFTIGQGQVIKGWDEGFASMKVGEKALLEIAPDYGYGAMGSPPKIPASATLIFEVELLGFQEKHKEKWEMSDAERAAMALKLKTEGTASFSSKDFAKAATKYEQAGDYAVGEGITGNDIPAEELPLFVSCWSNVAMCRLKLKEWADAIHATNRVLELDDEASNIKALYRRGLARMNLGLLKESKEDLMKAYKADNSNKDIRKALASLKEAMAEAKRKEKAAFGGIFGKSLYDDKAGPLIPNSKGDNPHVFCKYHRRTYDCGFRLCQTDD